MQPTIPPPASQPRRHTLRRVVTIVVLLAIIVTATFFVVRNVQHKNLVDNVKSTLIKQNKTMKAAAVNSSYKQTLPSTVVSTKQVKIDTTVDQTGVSYCILATSITDGKIIYHMNEKTPEDTPSEGDCSTNNTSVASVPGDVVVASSGIQSITLQWSASLYASGYTAECALNESFTAGMHSQTTSNLSVKFENLTTDTVFFCRVAATNQYGQSIWAQTLQARTSLKSQPPTAMKATIISSSEIGYSWNAVAGAQYYMLQYTTDINFVNDVITMRVDSTEGSIKGLQPYTGYFVRSEAITSQFDQTHAAFSDAAFARTKK